MQLMSSFYIGNGSRQRDASPEECFAIQRMASGTGCYMQRPSLWNQKDSTQLSRGLEKARTNRQFLDSCFQLDAEVRKAKWPILNRSIR